jgi:hypothetical protein
MPVSSLQASEYIEGFDENHQHNIFAAALPANYFSNITLVRAMARVTLMMLCETIG